MNEKKVAFITCVNDDEEYKECLLYLNHLRTPENFTIEFIPVRNAPSMTAGYEAARKKSEAKYKIYLHQDVRVIKKDFFLKILKMFDDDPKTGLIGLAGCEKLPESLIWWNSDTSHMLVAHSYRPEHIEIDGSVISECDVEAVDGVLMATQYDLPWREDIFTGWHFYDISQSMEFIRHGYKVKLAAQNEPWIIHNVEFRQLYEDDYGRWREILAAEYGKELEH